MRFQSILVRLFVTIFKALLSWQPLADFSLSSFHFLVSHEVMYIDLCNRIVYNVGNNHINNYSSNSNNSHVNR